MYVLVVDVVIMLGSDNVLRDTNRNLTMIVENKQPLAINILEHIPSSSLDISMTSPGSISPGLLREVLRYIMTSKLQVEFGRNIIYNI